MNNFQKFNLGILCGLACLFGYGVRKLKLQGVGDFWCGLGDFWRDFWKGVATVSMCIIFLCLVMCVFWLGWRSGAPPAQTWANSKDIEVNWVCKDNQLTITFANGLAHVLDNRTSSLVGSYTVQQTEEQVWVFESYHIRTMCSKVEDTLYVDARMKTVNGKEFADRLSNVYSVTMPDIVLPIDLGE